MKMKPINKNVFFFFSYIIVGGRWVDQSDPDTV